MDLLRIEKNRVRNNFLLVTNNLILVVAIATTMFRVAFHTEYIV